MVSGLGFMVEGLRFPGDVIQIHTSRRLDCSQAVDA